MYFTQERLDNLLALTRHQAYATAASLAIFPGASAKLQAMSDQALHEANLASAGEISRTEDPKATYQTTV